MTTDNENHLLGLARRERARRWVGTDLRGYPTLSAEEETEETLWAEGAGGAQRPRPGPLRPARAENSVGAARTPYPR